MCFRGLHAVNLFEGEMSKQKKKWVASAKTDSTHPPARLFKKKATTIARVLASKRVSPKGPQSGMRMLNYYVKSRGKRVKHFVTGRVGTREEAFV